MVRPFRRHAGSKLRGRPVDAEAEGGTQIGQLVDVGTTDNALSETGRLDGGKAGLLESRGSQLGERRAEEVGRDSCEVGPTSSRCELRHPRDRNARQHHIGGDADSRHDLRYRPIAEIRPHRRRHSIGCAGRLRGIETGGQKLNPEELRVEGRPQTKRRRVHRRDSGDEVRTGRRGRGRPGAVRRCRAAEGLVDSLLGTRSSRDRRHDQHRRRPRHPQPSHPSHRRAAPCRHGHR